MAEKNEKVALSILVKTCDHIKTEVNSIGLYNASDRLDSVFENHHHALISEKHLKCTTKIAHGVQDLQLGLTVSDILGLGIRHVVFKCTHRNITIQKNVGSRLNIHFQQLKYYFS